MSFTQWFTRSAPMVSCLSSAKASLSFGADAVHGRHEDRLAIFFHVQREQAAEAADLAEHLAAMRAGEQLRQRGLDAIAQINVHAGGGVSFLFLFHETRRQI
jgi:hypothetical protein